MSPSAGSQDPTAVEFALLGPLLVSRDGSPLQLGGSRQRAVLALLLLQPNTVVSLAHLIHGVWGEDPPAAAAQTLQTYVFHLRRELEPGRALRSPSRLLETSRSGYVLAVDPQQTDVGRFQDGIDAARAARKAGSPRDASRLLGDALGLWRGPVLDDLAEYEFVAPEAARLQDIRLVAVEAKFEADLAQGFDDEVAAECERWIAREPLRERLREISMLALYRAGRQAESLSGYRRAREVLATQLGVEPGPGLERMHHAVLGHDPALDYVRPAEPAAVPAPAAPAAPMLGSREAAVNVVEAAEAGQRSARRFPARFLVAAGVALALLAFGTVRRLSDEPPRPPQDATSSVIVLDPANGRMVRSVQVGSDPTQIASGAGAVWVTNRQDATVSRIDPATLAVTQTIDVDASPEDVAVGAGFVWVACSGGRTLAQIDPRTNRVVRTITVGNGPVAVAATVDGVWVANRFDDTVWRIDPESAQPVAKIAVGDAPTDVAIIDGGVWVSNSGDATVSRIDISRNKVTDVIAIGNGPVAVDASNAAVWVAQSLDGTVVRIDPSTGTQRSLEPTGDGPVDLVATDDGAWVANQYSATLTRLDSAEGHIVQRLDLSGAPRAVAMVGGRLWVSIGPGRSTGHRGGTLNVLEDIEDEGIDPAMDYASMMRLVYDGLVALRRTGGTPGFTVVPDLATSLPRPSEDGLTYVFGVRRGIRYSDGEVVKPSDFKTGLQRNLRGNPGSYYVDIRGAATCITSPTPLVCDLTDGVDADDDHYTLTIHLTKPDADFLAKLTVPFASATAPGAPAGNTGLHPLPSTGPYQIKSYTGKNGSVTLVRNPYFREWSWAARPDGFPDVITFRYLDHDTAGEVEAGRADVVPAEVGDVPVADQYRVHVSPGSYSFFSFFDMTRPPFDDVRVRRAVNYALDRTMAQSVAHGQVSCQVLPPGYPGYRPSCRYTLDPGSQWSAPDMKTARSLVVASRTNGDQVQVTSPKVLEPLALVVRQALRTLGYRTSLRVVSDDQYFGRVESGPASVQIGLYGWGPDYPSASGYLTALFSCRGATNVARFCDHGLESEMNRATTLEATDPAAASTQWAAAEQGIMAASPVAPLLIETRSVFVSARLGNYQDNPIAGPLYDQMWVR